MTGPAMAVPPLSVAAPMLRKTTERLARECVQPSIAAPAWNEVEWAVACAASAMQGITVLLANRVRWVGPPFWQAFLADQREHSRRRDSKIGILLERLDAALRAAGCRSLAMKGAAIRELDIYEPGVRPMSDVDLLVASDDAGTLEDVLYRLDYVHSYDTRRHFVFDPRTRNDPGGFAEHADRPLKIEVHTKVSAQLPSHEVDITGCLQSEEASTGIGGYRSTTALLLHLILHTAGNMCTHAARQIQLHDIALVARLMRASDWCELLAARDDGERRWWLYPPLAMTENYYDGAIPADVLREARLACPRALRSWIDRQALTDVSWSNLRLSAFPGIAWASTLLEAIRFVHGRVWRSSETVGEYAGTVKRDGRLSSNEWYRISRSGQVLRWLLSPVPRAKSMWVLRAALESAQEAKGSP